MKSEITNTLIKKLHESVFDKCLRKELEAEVPELFKPKFKVGDWVINSSAYESIHRIDKIDSYYIYGSNCSSPNMKVSSIDSKANRLATDKEIEKHLISIWEGRHGKVKHGSPIINVEGCCREICVAGCQYSYDTKTDTLFLDGFRLYEKGKWAEIIKEESPIELTLSDIAKLKGVDVSRIRIVE